MGRSTFLVVPAFVCHLDLWSEPPVDQLVRGLGGCGRVIIFDKRGSGLSDRPPDIRVDEWITDAPRVLDAVGIRTHGVGRYPLWFSDRGHVSLPSIPTRTSALVMFGAAPRNVIDDDYPYGLDREADGVLFGIPRGELGQPAAGSPRSRRALSGTLAARAFWARYQRLSASPSAVATFQRAITGVDARDILALVTAPTLVLHAARDAIVRPGPHSSWSN